MARAEDFLFRMVLMAHEGNEYGGNDSARDWIVNASLQKLRSGKLRANLTAEHIQTGDVLTYPQDADKIANVLPAEYWPAFIIDLLAEVPPKEQPTLLAEGK